MRKLTVMSVTLAALCMPPVLARAADKDAPASQGAAPVQETNIKGKVVERIDAAPYSYLKLSTPSGEVWVAVPQTSAEKGSEVTVANAFPMKDFESKTLKRKFDVVYFGTLGGAEGDAPANAGGMPAGHPPVSGAAPQGAPSGAAADLTDIKVSKASGPNAKTVAEIYAQSAALKDKPVAVQGKVVKYNAGIMGKNWIHLRDGSGTAEKSDNDITVTTQDQAAVGDVVTAKGTVRLDQDFGAGYKYPIVVEEAKISKGDNKASK